MNYNLDSLEKGLYRGLSRVKGLGSKLHKKGYIGEYYRAYRGEVFKGYARSLKYGSYYPIIEK